MNIEVTIINKSLIAENIVQLVLERTDGSVLPSFEPGAHIDLHIDSKTVRQYSLVNSLDNGKSYEIAILRDAAGRGGSVQAHDTLMMGNTINISEPRNHFPLIKSEHTLLIAGGIGITPILSMAQHLHNQSQSFELHYSARSSHSAAYYDEIKASAFTENTQFFFDEEGGKFNPEYLEYRAKDNRLFVCGPEGFITYIKNTALEAGWPEDRIHYELFSKSSTDTTGLGAPFSILVNNTGAIVHVAEEETALDALVRSGYEIPYSCEQGVCGSCVLDIIEGTPDHQDAYLTDKERAENRRFTPCCSRAQTPSITINL